MYSFLRTVVLCLYIAYNANAATTWTVPPPAGPAGDFSQNPVMVLGSSYELSWTTSQTEYSIWLWQADTGLGYTYPGQPIFTKTANQAETGTTVWTVDLQDFTLAGSSIYFLSLCQNSSLEGATTAHYFNVVAAASTLSSTAISVSRVTLPTSITLSSSTPSASAPTSPSSSDSSTNAGTSANPSVTPTSTTTSGNSSSNNSNTLNNSESSLGTNAKIGLGVGLGIGIPLLLIASTILFLMFRKQQRQPQYHAAAHGDATLFSFPSPDKNLLFLRREQHREKHELAATASPNMTRHYQYERQELPSDTCGDHGRAGYNTAPYELPP